MKKYNIKNLIPLIAACAIVLIAVPVRIKQYLTIIDAKTGFYNETDFSVTFLYFILAVGIILSIVVPFIKHKSIEPVSLSNKSTGFAVISLLVSMALIYDSAVQLLGYFNLYSEASTELAGKALSQYISMQGGMLLMLQAVFGAICALYFFISGVTIGLGNADSSKYKVLALVPVIWSIFKLLYRFKRTISFVNVSDLLLELFFIVFTMMFFFALAQVNSKIDAGETEKAVVSSVYWKIFAYGIPTAIFGILCFLPRFVLLLTGSKDHINALYPANAADIGIALFAIYTCITALKAKEEKNED